MPKCYIETNLSSFPIQKSVNFFCQILQDKKKEEEGDRMCECELLFVIKKNENDFPKEKLIWVRATPRVLTFSYDDSAYIG